MAQTFLWIGHLYQDLLGRQPEDFGLLTFTAALDSGRATRFQVAQAIIASPEYRTNTVEFLYITVGSSLFVGLVAAVSGTSTLLILVALVLGAALPFGFVWLKAARRLRQIEDSLPDLLLTVAASLKAGHSFRQGIQNVVEEGEGPAAKEFKRVMTETQLGKPIDDSLAHMAARVGSVRLIDNMPITVTNRSRNPHDTVATPHGAPTS